MYLIVGLGNPGKKYEHTRHNFGFAALDLLVSGQAWESKYHCEFLKLDDVILAKPQTFMNNSGTAVREIMKFYPDAELIVVHDELDLPLGSLRVQKNVSAAGHNGVQSIIDELGTQNFIRVRLGIESIERGETPGDAFVLQPFTAAEQTAYKEILERAKSAVETLQTDGLELAQSKFNG